MVRVGGMGYTIDPTSQMGSRISDMTFLKTGEPIEPTGTMSSPAGLRSTKAPKVRRSGMSWKGISPKSADGQAGRKPRPVKVVGM
jgi:hypothetical protein